MNYSALNGTANVAFTIVINILQRSNNKRYAATTFVFVLLFNRTMCT